MDPMGPLQRGVQRSSLDFAIGENDKAAKVFNVFNGDLTDDRKWGMGFPTVLNIVIFVYFECGLIYG